MQVTRIDSSVSVAQTQEAPRRRGRVDEVEEVTEELKKQRLYDHDDVAEREGLQNRSFQTLTLNQFNTLFDNAEIHYAIIVPAQMLEAFGVQRLANTSVTFGGERIPLNSKIMAKASPVFRDHFEREGIIDLSMTPLVDLPFAAIEAIFKFCYIMAGITITLPPPQVEKELLVFQTLPRMLVENPLKELSTEHLFAGLGVAYYFHFSSLSSVLLEMIRQRITTNNFEEIYQLGESHTQVNALSIFFIGGRIEERMLSIATHVKVMVLKFLEGEIKINHLREVDASYLSEKARILLDFYSRLQKS